MPTPEDHREISEKAGIRVSDKIEYQRQTGVFQGHVLRGTELENRNHFFTKRAPSDQRPVGLLSI